ncbi:MAG TPA: 50S ribosomal protein L10 [Spirochaetota bacterium]|nr:50S ribosomal protein L10 [Spirochaetota bacterium]HQA53504.1 50S ribosomal protein L10 [Spirochaetota bacterium]
MVKQYKIDEVAQLTEKLNGNKNVILTNYSGIKVSALTQLRNDVKKTGAKFQVVKNNYFRKALKDCGYDSSLDDYLKGPVAVAFAGDQVGEVAKLFKDFQKEQEKFELVAGVIEGVVYGADGIRKIADLPSKEVLLSKVLYLVNAPTSKIAIGMNQIMASVARGINAVAEKNAQ